MTRPTPTSETPERGRNDDLDIIESALDAVQREHSTDDGLACWCRPYRDSEEPTVIIHRKEGES